MLKKVIAFITLLLTICSPKFLIFAYSDVTDSYSMEAIDFLSSQGILNGYEDGTFKPQENVTRAEFTAMIMRIQKLDSLGSTGMTYYPDISRDHWALSDINIATGMRLISGYEDGTFRPDENITLTDALKIIVCLLGYQAAAEVNGGYPDGYIKTAADIGVLDRVTTQYNSFVTREVTALMLYNSLEIELYESTGTGFTKTGRNLLNDILGLFQRKGVITATKYGELIPADTLSDDEIIIDGVKFKITDSFMHELIGYHITFYFKEEDDQFIITYYTINEKKNQSIMVAASDLNVDHCTTSVFSYYNENGKQDNIRLDAQYVVKNGVSTYFETPSVFEITDGNIFLVDNDHDGAYENIFINEVKNIVVGRINKTDKIITDKFTASKKLAFGSDDIDKTVVIRYNDEEISFEEIAVGDIITYIESDDKSKLVAYISKNIIETTIDSVGRNGNDFRITAKDALEYIMSKECLAELESSQEKMNTIRPGTAVTLYVNTYGQIAQIVVDGAEDEEYAFLVSARYDDGGIDESAFLKIYTAGGSVRDYEINTKITFNDGYEKKKLTPQEVVEKLGETRLVTEDDYVKNPYFQLIKCRIDKDGKIKSITSARSSSGGKPLRIDGVFTRDFLASSVKTNQKDIINGAYKLSENVKIFNIPPEHNDYSAYSDSITFSSNITATVVIYDMGRDNLFDALLVINPDYNSYYDNSKYKPFFTFDNVSTGINDDDEVVYYANGVYNRSVRDFEFNKEPSFAHGDIYQFLEAGNKVIKINKIYDAKTQSFAAGAANKNGLGIDGSATAEIVLGVMKVRNISPASIVVTDGDTELLLTISNATRYTLNTSRNISNADVSEIEEGDLVAFRTFNGTAGDIVIIR